MGSLELLDGRIKNPLLEIKARSAFTGLSKENYSSNLNKAKGNCGEGRQGCDSVCTVGWTNSSGRRL